MEIVEPADAHGSYFAAGRLWRQLRGRNPVRSEADWREAYFVGCFVFLISYLFAVHVVLGDSIHLTAVPMLILLVFGTWLCWPAIFYLNSIVADLCRRLGLFTDLPPSRVQNVLVGLLTSVFAAELLVAESWLMRGCGALWLGAVAVNLAAAFVLALFPERKPQSA